MSARWLQGFALVAALLLLNVSLTFHNVWPTPAISWRGELSAELAAYIVSAATIGVIAARRRSSSTTTPISATWLRVITIVWIGLVLGRYADVTATALFGRDINLYWDLRFIPDVVSLLAKAAHIWLVLGVVAAVALVLTLLYVVLRWAIGEVTRAARDPGTRAVLATVSAIVLLLFAAESTTRARPWGRRRATCDADVRAPGRRGGPGDGGDDDRSCQSADDCRPRANRGRGCI